ncbi:MAG: hypothetical protein IJB86_03565 [Clostridia bacterium]|nr:hypothetical protein [Clostridia bacterium]
MRKKTARMMTGIGIGMAVGALSGAITSSVTGKKTICGCNTSKAMRSVENMIDGIQSIMK